jgi:hypothetical protein
MSFLKGQKTPKPLTANLHILNCHTVSYKHRDSQFQAELEDYILEQKLRRVSQHRGWTVQQKKMIWLVGKWHASRGKSSEKDSLQTASEHKFKPKKIIKYE